MDPASSIRAAIVTLFAMTAAGQTSPVTVTAVADSYLRSGQPNQAFSTSTFLRVQDSGDNRTLVRFDQSAIAGAVGTAGLTSAKLRLYIVSNGNNWGSLGGTVAVHRLTAAWTEAGATWNCPNDTNPSNSSADCTPSWNMGSYPSWPFAQVPTQVIVHINALAGWVEWDVTPDVASFLGGTANYGWVVRKTDENASGRADYSSREGSFAPQLVLTLGTPPNPPPPSPTLLPTGDTYLRSGSANQNQGYDTILQVQDSGNNRSLIQFNQSQMAAYVGTGTLTAAHLRLYVTDNANNWGTTGRQVNVHRITQSWTEQGATWNCPNDSDPFNSSKDCAPDWNMSQSAQWPFVATPTATMIQQNNQTGWVDWDVTSDVAAFLAGSSINYGWIVRKDNEGQAGQVSYSSREGAFSPQLVLTATGGQGISVSVDPNSVVLIAGQVQQFAATVVGTATTSVTWSISPAGLGSISSAGLYTAPSPIADLRVVSVTAASVADSSKSANASILLQPVQIEVAPTGVTLSNLQSAQFTATVTGSANQNVTWSVSPSVGTVTATGLYTAPRNILTSQTVTITATAAADGTHTGTVTINLISSGQISSVSPASIRVGEAATVNVTGQGTNFADGMTTLDLGSGIVIGPVTVTDSLTFSASITVSRDASLGTRNVGVNVANVPLSLANGFTVQPGLPNVSISSPAPQSFTSVSPVTVHGIVSDPSANVTVNGIAASVSGGGFVAQVPLVEGNNELLASAQGAAGVGTTSVQVTLDTTPPKIAIASPPASSTTTASSIRVSGTINDLVVGTVNDQQATVTVNGTPATVANRTFLSADVPLSLGANTISVVGADRSGNSATTSLVVTRLAQTQPEIRVVSGANQSGRVSTQLAAPLVVSLVDQAGLPQAGRLVIFKVAQGDGSLNGGGATVTEFHTGSITSSAILRTDAQGRASVNWTLGSRAGAASNRVDATAAGFSGTGLFLASADPSAAGQIHVDAGQGQTGAVNSTLTFPFVVVVTDIGHNRLQGVPVTFAVIRGGGTLGGQSAVTKNTDSDGRALVTLMLGASGGIENNVVTATFPGNARRAAVFTASALVPGDPAQTRVSGVVLDNASTPLPAVTMRLYQPYLGQANNVPLQVGPAVQTDAQGQFTMTGVPVGRFRLMADPSTTTRPGSWPTLEFDVVTVAGQNNTVGMPIYLVALDTVNKLCVTGTTGGVLTLLEVPGFSLTVQPGSVTFAGGSQSGCVSVTPVHIDKIPMMPSFGQQPRFVVTIQPVGAVFSPPATLTIPNMDGLNPRQMTELFSFDHDLNSFVGIGTGTVSDDGRIIQSDAGIGVLKAGWFGNGSSPPDGDGENVNTSLSPERATQAPSDLFTLTGGGTPSDSVFYTWQIQSSDPEDDPAAFSFAQQPSCPGLPVCVSTLNASRPAQAQVQLLAQTNGASDTKRAKVTAVQITVQKIWSDQFNSSNVANFLPGGAGTTGNASLYVLAGAGLDSQGRIGADLVVAPNTVDVRRLLKAAFRTSGGALKGTSDPFQVTSGGSGPAQGYIKVHIPEGDMNAVVEGGIVFGLDSNENGKLDPNEVRATGDAVGKFKLVSKSQWNSTLTLLNDEMRVASFVYPNAADWTLSFAAGDQNMGPGSSPSTGRLVTPSLFGDISHKVGVNFDSPTDGTIPIFTHSADSRMSGTILKSKIILDLVQSAWTSHRGEVEAYFANPANQSPAIFSWVLQDGSIEFPDLGLIPVVDYDLFSALHFAKITQPLTLTITANRNSSTVVHAVSGQISDLFDFDYDKGGHSLRAAIVQAGFGTLGGNGSGGGQVRGNIVNLNKSTALILRRQ